MCRDSKAYDVGLSRFESCAATRRSKSKRSFGGHLSAAEIPFLYWDLTNIVDGKKIQNRYRQRKYNNKKRLADRIRKIRKSNTGYFPREEQKIWKNII